MFFDDVLKQLILFLAARFPNNNIGPQTDLRDLITPDHNQALIEEVNDLPWVREAGMFLRAEEGPELRWINGIAVRLFRSIPAIGPGSRKADDFSDEIEVAASHFEVGPRQRAEQEKDDVGDEAFLAEEFDPSLNETEWALRDLPDPFRSEDTDQSVEKPPEQHSDDAHQADSRPLPEVNVPAEVRPEQRPWFNQYKRVRGMITVESASRLRPHNPQSFSIPLWFGTNRKPVDERDIDKGFSSERDSRTHLGLCKVHIPKSHKIGSIGSPWWKRMIMRIDDRLKIASLQEYSTDHFWRSVTSHLGKLNIGEREAVIFVHGYNVSFSDAAIRAAQLGADLAIRGCMAFFSWPSKGSTHSYMHDEASIDASEGAITQFLVDFAENSGATKLHLIAHSMGNRGVLRAVNRIAAAAAERTGKPFDQIILAAPDVDADVFRGLCKAYSQVSSRTTLYVSSRDWAVEAARWLHGFPRAGLLPPVMVAPGIDTVNVTHADLTRLGHGYVAEARLVLTDMHFLLRFGAHPTDRAGLQMLTSDDGQPYWLIGR